MQRLINALESAAAIARQENQLEAAGVIFSLLGALKMGTTRDLFDASLLITRRDLAAIEAYKSVSQGGENDFSFPESLGVPEND